MSGLESGCVKVWTCEGKANLCWEVVECQSCTCGVERRRVDPNLIIAGEKLTGLYARRFQ